MKEIIMNLNHWWVYLIMTYYVTWLVTYQILLYKNIRKDDGTLGPQWVSITSLFTRHIWKAKIKTIGDIVSLLQSIISLIICVVWLILVWAFLTMIGFWPVINNMISSCKVNDRVEGMSKDDEYAFPQGSYKNTFLIKAWIALFTGIIYLIKKIFSIRIIRKEIV